MKKKILITGSNGFLGNLAKEYFIQNYELVFVDLSTSSDANFYKVDIGNFTEIDDVITKEKPNIIFHFASEIFDTYNKKKIYRTNVEGSNNIKKSAIKNNVENLIFTSTFSLFEENYDYLISESEPISCKNYYGITKSKVERLLLESDSELNISIFRCPIIVDKSRAHRLGVLFEFLKDNCTLWILGDGSNKLQFVSASDLFIAFEKSLNLKGKYVYNIGCEKVETMKETFEYLINKTGSKSKIRHFNKNLGLFILKILSFLRLINFIDYHNKILVSNIVLDISRIKKDLNFTPTKSTAELMLDAHNYYLNNSNLTQKGSAIKPKMGFFSVIKFISKII
jgi:nucleoside-diphosphate-sugar epimerase|tara:strand:- start:75 stop:1091 length:1017 start_codon:yes stop_codon:yes gene_type:complete